jgi:acyl carrier protein
MSMPIPQGIEVLVKKASIDPAFKTSLLEGRAAAADEIGLLLEPAEAMILAVTPREQLETVIARATVPQEHRRAFLGHAAAAMLAALGVVACGDDVAAEDVKKKPEEGNVKKLEEYPSDELIEKRISEILSKQFNVPKKDLKKETSFVKDLHATETQIADLKKLLEKEFKLTLPEKQFKSIPTVGVMINIVKWENNKRKPVQIRGIRPDRVMPAPGGMAPDRPPPGNAAPK